MDTKIIGSDQILSSDLGDEIVMMSIDEGKYFSLRGPAGRVWELLKQPVTPKAMIDILIEEYDVSAEQCEDELIALINDMFDGKLVKFV